MSARIAVILVALAAAGAGAQAPPTALQRLTMLDAKAKDGVERGDAVAVTLDAADKSEIVTLGAVRLEVPRAFYIDHVKQLTGFLAGASRAQSGTFSDPAKVEDLASLTLEPSDAKALEKCQPLKCDVKLPAEQMERFRAALANSRDQIPRADSLMREWLVSLVNAYRADSAEQMVVYDDTKGPVRSSDAFRQLVLEPLPAGIDSEPFATMLAGPRTSRPAAVSSRVAWEVDRMPGLKPTLEVVERSMYTPPSHPEESAMTTKLLYATHYFEAQVDFLTVSDAPSANGAGASYLIVLRRQKFDDLPSGGLFNIRGKAIKRLRDAMKSTLASTRAELAKAYAESQGPAVHAP